MRTASLEWTWGDRIRKLRKALDLSQDEFAQLVEIRGGTIAGWEASDGKPRQHVQTAQNIAARLDIEGLDLWLLGMGPTPVFGDLEAVTLRYQRAITTPTSQLELFPDPVDEPPVEVVDNAEAVIDLREPLEVVRGQAWRVGFLAHAHDDAA